MSFEPMELSIRLMFSLFESMINEKLKHKIDPEINRLHEAIALVRDGRDGEKG
jgi:hypothetical protein